MRNLLSDRRGSAAFATVVALVPLIGVLALGAEAGTWYVTKQRAQAAADAAAYSGGLKLACDLAGQTGIACTDARSVEYRGKQFAAQNAFCNGGDTSYPRSTCKAISGVSQSVVIATNANTVQATVSQIQPGYLSTFLGFPTVTITAKAKAEVDLLSNPCALALSGSISFQGSPTVTAPNCGLTSNSTAADAINFTGNNGIDITNAGTISAQGGCTQTGGSQCSKVLTYVSPAPNLLSGLDAAIASLTKADFSAGSCGATFRPYGSGTNACYNNNNFPTGDATLAGVYFVTGNIIINGSVTITGTTTLILLPPKFLSNGDKGATLTISGNPTIQLVGTKTITAAQVPAKLSSVLNLMSNLLIYDPERTNKGVSITGGSTSYFSGITYVPNSPVTYQGSTVKSSCTEVIAYAITLTGNSSFDNSQCSAGGNNQTAKTQIVKLVQ